MRKADLVVVGAGIVGMATAYQYMKRFPDRRVVVLEKESEAALHQTGRNSGVIHSGIYYRPGSLKAINCRRGKALLEAFCEAEELPFERCGKVIVAVDDGELPTLEMLYDRGKANGVRCRMIGREELGELEPHAAGIRAIHVEEAGIVNYRQVCSRIEAKLRGGSGGEVVYGARVTAIRPGAGEVAVESTAGSITAAQVINCAGLYSDRLVAASGQRPAVRIIPFRGEYYHIREDAHQLCRNLIYPVPDPAFPFLGVHFTRMIDGSRECGPNAVLAFGRESYFKHQVHPGEMLDYLGYSGFHRLVARHWKMGMGEMWRSLNKGAFVRALQRLVPDIRAEHISPAPAGIRAQAVAPDGRLADDFLFVDAPRLIHVCNVPSPAATSSLNIGLHLVERLVEADRS